MIACWLCADLEQRGEVYAGGRLFACLEKARYQCRMTRGIVGAMLAFCS